MKEISLISYVNEHLEDDYAMNIFYYTVKKNFAEQGFTLNGCSHFFIDGRFLGKPLKVSSSANYRSTTHSLAFLLSLRLLITNHMYLELCDDDSLIFISKPRESFRWINYFTLIMDNWDDDEVKMLFRLMENYYYDEELSEEEKSEFVNSIVVPEYRNEKNYYQYLAQKTKGVSEYVIGNNAFVEAKIEKFTVSKDIAYVGNTAFAYCDSLGSIEFEGKTLFGKFPIIECANIKQIIVPDGLGNYYKECLPHYKNLISEKGVSSAVEKQTFVVKSTNTNIKNEEIEQVFVDIPSAFPYTEIEVVVQESPKDLNEKKKDPIDVSTLRTVFDRKVTSYKFFWLIAILSLAKENNHLSISFKDIAVRMASLAWPIIYEFGVDLGNVDRMEDYLDKIVKRTSLIRTASSKVVEEYLLQHYSSQGLDKILAPLLKNVPYRFLTPWIKFTTNEEVIEKSCSKVFNGPYALHHDSIVIDEEWWKYLDSHYKEICDFTLRSFLAYAKKFNSEISLLKLMTKGWQLTKD